MMNLDLLPVMIGLPFVMAFFCIFTTKLKVLSFLSIAGSLGAVATIVYVSSFVLGGETINTSFYYLDSLSMFFLLISSFVSLTTVIYSYGYMQHEQEHGEATVREIRFYYIMLNILISAILATFAMKSMALIWVGISATTLISSFLVGFHKDGQSTEAAWKYVIICSVGITLALFGVVMLYAAVSTGSHGFNSLDWPVLVELAANIDPVFIKFAAVFILIGYGTKMGLVPMHTWLPDAHSQAPAPISGMMSGILLNCALYGIIRFYVISEITVPGFAKTLLLLFGMLSLGVAAAFILRSKNIKRMLAYSSIENMGLIAIALGIGTPLALFGAFFQILAHSVTKPLMFFSAGNAVQEYGTRDMTIIRGVSSKMRFTGMMMTVGTLAIAGAPPFALFIGEASIIMGTINAGQYAVLAITAVLLVVVFAGLINNIFPMLSGKTDADVSEPKGISRHLAILMLAAVTMFFGLFMPDVARETFDAIVKIMGGIL